MTIFHRIVPPTLPLSVLFGSLLLTLSACSTLTAPPEHSATPATTSSDSSTGATDPQAPEVNTEKLPNVELTDEIFFKLTSAEIAFQRGEFPSAFGTIISVAQKTRDPRLAKRALEMALIAKQPAQAFYAARMWRDFAPDSEEALQYYAGFLVLNNDWDQIQSVLSTQLEKAAPKQRGVLILQTQRLLMRGSDKEQAFKTLEKLFAPYPDYLETHLALSQAAFESNNSVRSMIEADIALKIQPDSQIAILTKAQVSPTPDEALKVLATFLDKNPSAAEVRRAYATMLIEQKQYALARDQFDKLLSANPNDPSTLYTVGVLSLQINDVAAAETHLKAFVAAVEEVPDSRDPTNAYLYLSQIADDRKDGDLAINWLSKIKSYDGKNAAYFNAQLRRAVLMSKYDSLEHAREFLHQLAADPEEQIQIVQLDAELLRNADHNDEALTLLQTALKGHPDNPELLYDYAMMCEKFDRIDDMEKALRRVIEINPGNQQAYNALGYSLADRNIRLPEARALIEKALSMSPDDAFVIDSMGWLEFRENNKASALQHLQRAYSLRPDAEIAAHVGEVLWMMGEQKKALTIWREARDKDPNNAALKSMLLRLNVNL